MKSFFHFYSQRMTSLLSFFKDWKKTFLFLIILWFSYRLLNTFHFVHRITHSSFFSPFLSIFHSFHQSTPSNLNIISPSLVNLHSLSRDDLISIIIQQNQKKDLLISSIQEINHKLEHIQSQILSKSLQMTYHDHLPDQINATPSEQWSNSFFTLSCIALFSLGLIATLFWYFSSPTSSDSTDLADQMTNLVEAQAKVNNTSIQTNLEGIDIIHSFIQDAHQETILSFQSTQHLQPILNEFAQVSQLLNTIREENLDISTSIHLLEQQSTNLMSIIRGLLKALDLEPQQYIEENLQQAFQLLIHSSQQDTDLS